MVKKAISRHDERGEMASLSKTRSKILLLLVLLMGGQDFHGILGMIGFGIHVSKMQTSKIQSVSWAQRPQIKRSPWSSVGGDSGGEEVEEAGAKEVTGVGAGQGEIRGSSHTALGVKEWAARSATSSCNSL